MSDVKVEFETTGAPAGSLRELIYVSLPLVISAGSLSLMTAIDRMFLARLSVDALAASMPSALLNFTMISLPLGIAGYTNAFVSQYEGAGRKDRVAASIWQGLFIAIVFGVLMLPTVLFSGSIFGWMGHEPHVVALEVPYFNALCPVGIPMLVSSVLSAFFMARKKTYVLMWTNLGTGLVNGILDPILIFGWGSIPSMGMNGAAYATVFAQYLGMAALIWLLIREAQASGYPFAATFRLERELLIRNLKFGFPNGVQMLLDVGAFMLFVALTGKLGILKQAATNLAFTLNSLAFIPMMGLGTAVVTLVGHRIGEGQKDLAAKTVWNAFYFSGAYMIAFAAIYLSVPDVILTPFMHEGERERFEEMRPIIIVLLQFVAFYTFFDAMAIIFGSAIRGAGDTFYSLVFSVGCGWILMVLPTWWFVENGYGLYHCWFAITLTVVVMGIGFMWRFIGGKWKKMQLIETDPLKGLE
ncbi:MATE family efflux transporter [Planctomicrobium sp. SH668]|uniref:MATE family efflux transporter n=1 Tax=Planctomicrobium sp. SH668 TaxID=3448126 RepID=UPI003F5C465D